MKASLPVKKVYVLDTAFDSSDPYDIVYSNVRFLNGLLERHLNNAELCPQALTSYHVDFYFAQIQNGGFSQFVYNSRWDPAVVADVGKGLRTIGCSQHAKLFRKCEALLAQFPEGQLEAYLKGEYFGENPVRDELNSYGSQINGLSSEEIVTRNAAWLRKLRNLTVLNQEDFQAAIEHFAALPPDREERRLAALRAEPRYMKLIRKLCQENGLVLDRVTIGTHTTYRLKRCVAWHFLTDRGQFYMIDLGSKALMFTRKGWWPRAKIVVEPGFK